jgi:hypothetical protein
VDKRKDRIIEEGVLPPKTPIKPGRNEEAGFLPPKPPLKPPVKPTKEEK